MGAALVVELVRACRCWHRRRFGRRPLQVLRGVYGRVLRGCGGERNGLIIGYVTEYYNYRGYNFHGYTPVRVPRDSQGRRRCFRIGDATEYLAYSGARDRVDARRNF